MQLIYWHIIGWLQYGNFVNAIRLLLLLMLLYGSHSIAMMILCRCIGFMQRNLMLKLRIRREHAFICLSTNRLSILYMVIKLRDECEKSISAAKGHILFVFCQHEHGILPDQTPNN